MDKCLLACMALMAVGSLASRNLQEVGHHDGHSTIATDGLNFAAYKAQFGRTYAEDTKEHAVREEIFNARIAQMEAHNSGSHSWTMGVNHFTDRNEEELRQARGYARTHPLTGPSSGAASLMQTDGDGSSCAAHSQTCMDAKSECCTGLTCGAHGICEQPKAQPKSLDWNSHLATSVLDQGGCGSCWAVAATAAIQLHAAHVSNNTFTKQLSPQGMLGCAPNPQKCGGDGGCAGSTPELALQWVKEHGVQLLEKQAYTASNNCPTSFMEAKPAVQIGGYVRLAENKADQVMNALVTAGPLAVAIAAGNVHSYRGGVFDGCRGSTVVDHAVVLVGYGEQKGKAYWKIQNSWGPDWGEEGFFKIRRHAPHGEEPCGWDHEPLKGVGCKGGPEKLWVCGECGILSDVAYPVGTKVDNEIL